MPQAPIRDSPRPLYGAGPPPYAAIEVAFQNAADNVQLAGTLTVPRGAPNAPAVLLSQGLGFEPFDRDYTIPSAPALKSFLAIADALSRNGIVVLRVDDRGAGRSSGQKPLSSGQLSGSEFIHVEPARAGRQAPRCVHVGDGERERPGTRVRPRRAGSHHDAVGEVSAAPPVPGPDRSPGRPCVR